MKHNERFLAVVNDAKTRVRETDVATIARRLDAGEAFRLIDVREDHEWAAGRLPRAEHIGRGVLERDVEKLIPDTAEEIVLYCGGGYRSALAADMLQKMGYTNVWSMDGGFRDWKESGREILLPDGQ